eukprot:EG_transcript_7922
MRSRGTASAAALRRAQRRALSCLACCLRSVPGLRRPTGSVARLFPLIFLSMVMFVALHGMLVAFPTNHRLQHIPHIGLTSLRGLSPVRTHPLSLNPTKSRHYNLSAALTDLLEPATPRAAPRDPATGGNVVKTSVNGTGNVSRPHVRYKAAPGPGRRAAAVLCGALGLSAAVALASLGAGYGMTKAGLGLVHMCRLAPAVHMRGLLPVIMAELLAVYGFIFGLGVVGSFSIHSYTPFAGYVHLAAGLVVGFSALAAGLSIGLIGDANSRAYALLVRRLEDARRVPKRPSSPIGVLARLPLALAGEQDDAGAATAKAAAVADLSVASGRQFAATMLMLIFAEGIGLYGLIAGFLLHSVALSGLSDRPVELQLWAEAAPRPALCHQPAAAGLFGAGGAAASVGLATAGAAFGIARTSGAVCHLGVRRWRLTLRGTAPVVMAELLAIYGFVASLALVLGLDIRRYTLFAGYLDFGAGLMVGGGALAAGFAIGHIGDACVRAYAKQARLFAAMVLMLVFAEALGLCGLIAGIVLHGTATSGLCPS